LSTLDLTTAIRARLDSISTAATTAAEALDGAAIDLPEGTLAGILSELVSLDGRLDLALDRLAGAAEPTRLKPDPADAEATLGRRD
jgi:hypothetical protein